jgi:hypothetical protein
VKTEDSREDCRLQSAVCRYVVTCSCDSCDMFECTVECQFSPLFALFPLHRFALPPLTAPLPITQFSILPAPFPYALAPPTCPAFVHPHFRVEVCTDRAARGPRRAGSGFRHGKNGPGRWHNGPGRARPGWADDRTYENGPGRAK